MAGRQQTVSRRRKRAVAPVHSGITNSYQDKDSDFVCPVCFDIIEEAHMTKCGHSFCHKCIRQSLESNKRCPRCNGQVEGMDQVFPNFTLNDLITKHKREEAKLRKVDPQMETLTSLVDDSLDLHHVNLFLDKLMAKKQQLENDGKLAESLILKDFLSQVRERKAEKLEQLEREVQMLDEDLKVVQEDISEQQRQCFKGETVDHQVPNGFELRSTTVDSSSQDGFNGSKNAGRPWQTTSMAARRQKVSLHFDDLEQCYFYARVRGVTGIDGDANSGLKEFMDSLSKFTRFSSFRPLATLSYAVDLYNGGSSIVSSIEFDRDCDYFAIAGVTRKIKVYEYNTIIRDAVDIHYPCQEMVCNSKISCVTWSAYQKGMLASSDYEGTVTVWDAFTGQKTKIFQEHEKRCWSVDFNRMDPKLLASGSDDAKVKLWSTNAEHSVANVEAKANVCCVKFNPESRFHLAFGSADHCVHYYDLRNTKQAVCVFRGHRKAVSYAKFLGATEIVSASTDSQLKLWTVGKANAVRTFIGHANEKNFVGLATDGDYIACGSENNSLYIYYKGLCKQLMTYKFDTVRSVLERDRREEDANEFVSAVTWRPGSNVVVAANSQGTVKILELV